ncbi:hypothetical protein [Enterococcus faecalis]|uniref:hypothetical protein n=1 Tax=Enterococcus faecalis TaxID=1351 RepID=UPI00242E33DA|nr:hypothetical protein [Enterococcus faecalis]
MITIADILALVLTIGLFYVIVKYGKKIHNIIQETIIVLIEIIGFSISSLTKLGLIFFLGCICFLCIVYVLGELSDLFYSGINRVNWLGIFFSSAVFYFATKKIREKIFLLNNYFKSDAKVLNIVSHQRLDIKKKTYIKRQ